MAKMVKCPTCGTAIEVPAQLTGQVLKCPGCGKGLKLVAKKPAQPPAGATPAGGLNASVAGASVSAMTFHGDAPPIDDPPSLDTNCAVCGRTTDPDDLVEDNGRLVCPDCIKGARSFVERPRGGAEVLGFKAPAYQPVRRAKIVSITPSLIAAVFAALIWGGCQIYLSGHNKPVGMALAKIAKPQPKNPVVVEGPKPADPGPTPASQPTESAQVPTPTAPLPTPVAPSPTTLASATPTTPAPPGVEPATQGSKLFPQEPTAPVAPVASADPFDQGLDQLQAKDYAGAARTFETLRLKFPIRTQEQATPQQLAILEGLAAANLGLGNLEAARTRLDTALVKGDHSRSLVLNRAIANVVGHGGKLPDLDAAAVEIKHYLESHSGDEFAADLFGAMLSKITVMLGTGKDREKDRAALDPHWVFLESYTDQLAKDHPNQLKWGSEWIPAEEARRYRLLRNKADTLGVTKAQKDLDIARAKADSAKKKYDDGAANKARGGVVDLVGLQSQSDAANGKLADAQKAFDEASQLYKSPHWPEKFDPVMPAPVADAAK